MLWYNSGVIFQKGIRMTSTADKTKDKNRRTDKEAEWSGDFKRWREEWDKKTRAQEKRWDEVWKKVTDVADEFGNYGRQDGKRTEEEFRTALREEGKIGNIRIDSVVRLENRYEYDLVGVNGRAMVVGEVKTRMGAGDVVKFAKERLPHFVKDFPVYKKHDIYGMVCAQSFTPAACKEAEKRRLFVLRLKGRGFSVQNDKAQPVAQG